MRHPRSDGDVFFVYNVSMENVLQILDLCIYPNLLLLIEKLFPSLGMFYGLV